MAENYSNLFTVTPMNQKISLKPGETYVGSVQVANPATAESDFAYKVTVAPYTITGSDYAVDFAEVTNWSQIVNWTHIDEPTGSLKPNESKNVEFRIEVPEDAAGGGQYLALMVSSAPSGIETSGVNVKNIYEMASVVYAEVDGEIIQAGEIVDNNLPGFVTALPIDTEVVVQNAGNVHELANVEIKVVDYFSGNVVYPAEGDSGLRSEVVLPETTKNIVREIDGLAPVGVYRVTQTVKFLGETSEEVETVVVCPIWFIILVIMAIIGTIAAIVATIKIRRRKRALL